MKKITRIVIKSLALLAQLIYPYTLQRRITRAKGSFYTYWIISEFKSVGEKSTIGYPLDLRGGKSISLGSRVSIGKRVVLSAWSKYRNTDSVFHPSITIGDNTALGDECHITAISNITLGKNILIGRNVLITDNSHGQAIVNELSLPPLERPLHSSGPVSIEDGVWIGDKVTILPNVSIGRNSIIGANSVVTKHIPMNCVATGIPARVIKEII